MSAVLVTGATGLIGSVVCRQLRDAGRPVRALVRPGSDAGALASMGVEIVTGDVTDPGAVAAAATGCRAAIHSAALLGGPRQDPAEQQAVNVGGTANVLDAAAAGGLERVVVVSTTTFFDLDAGPLTEQSPLDPHPSEDPYTQTKRRAFLDAMGRAEAGQDVVVVVPGGTYGPAPQVARSMEPPSFNLRAVWGLRKEYDAYVSFPVPWSYVDDVAAATVAAMDRGVAGERYLAFGHPSDVTTTAGFMNLACRLAGVDHHVREITGSELDDPGIQTRFGPSLIALGRRRFPDPLFDNARTVARLDYRPVRLEEGLARTVHWLAANGLA